MRLSAKTRSARGMTRREFVGRTLTIAGVIAGAPAILRGQNLNKLNIAFIACGGRANASLAELTIVPGAARAKGRRPNAQIPSAPHPDENVTVLCDVNQDALDSASARYPKAKKVTDLRRVFDHPNDFDAVVVSTAEHTHAFATYLALTHGKHVFCEKPLAYNIWETRLIRETASAGTSSSTRLRRQRRRVESGSDGVAATKTTSYGANEPVRKHPAGLHRGAVRGGVRADLRSIEPKMFGDTPRRRG